MRQTVKINGQPNSMWLATSCYMHKASLTAPLLGGKTRILAEPFLSPQHCTGWIGQDEGKKKKMARHKQCLKRLGEVTNHTSEYHKREGGGWPKDLLIYYKERCLQFSHKWNTIQPYTAVVYFYKLSIYLQREGGCRIFWNCFSFVQADWIMTTGVTSHSIYIKTGIQVQPIQ